LGGKMFSKSGHPAVSAYMYVGGPVQLSMQRKEKEELKKKCFKRTFMVRHGRVMIF
jgi:hypothetical protein